MCLFLFVGMCSFTSRLGVYTHPLGKQLKSTLSFHLSLSLPLCVQIKQKRSSGDAEENILRFLQACTTLGIKKVGLAAATL